MMAADVAEQQRVRFVRVTNNTEQTWSDAFDGVPVTIEPGKSAEIPLDMAQHFFGWYPDVGKVEMMHHLARRRGWRDPKFWVLDDLAHDQKTADELFENYLTIEPVIYRLVEERGPKPAREAPVPALTDEDADERLREPTAVKDAASAGMVHPDEEPPAAPYRGRGRPPDASHGRKTEATLKNHPPPPPPRSHHRKPDPEGD